MKQDLEMTEGDQRLPNLIAHGQTKLTLQLTTIPFKGEDVLELVEIFEASF